MHGTLRALVANMVKGVTEGYEKRLALVGVGFRAGCRRQDQPVAGFAPGGARDARA
jgi:large subunit ribosomal protein L6